VVAGPAAWRRFGAVFGVLVVVLAVVVAVVVMLARGASSRELTATPGASAVQLAVTVGDAGTFIPGRPTPVRVAIQSDRLISGQLVVTTGFFQTQQPVEVAGGSSKQFEVVVPTDSAQTSLQTQVAVTERRTTLASSAPTVAAAPDTEVVGILSDLLVARALPGPAALSVDAGTARFVAISDQDLALAPASLGPLSAVALGPDSLARLSTAVRQRLLAWTSNGGRLLIDARTGDPVIGLPVAWQPSSGSSLAVAGVGQVVFTNGQMAAGQWQGLVAPVSHATGVAFQGGFGASASLSAALATDAGLKSPRLPWLIGFLVVYILLVGPVSFLVLRRRRRPELLWVVIPLLSLVFAATGYGIGSAGRSLRVVHGTIVDTTGAGGTALSYVGVLAGGQGTTQLDVPSGWVLQRYNDPQSAPPSAGTVGLKAVPTAQGVRGSIGLNAGQFAVVDATGPAGLAGQLAVTAHSTDAGAEGTVTNGTGYGLQDVSVLIGTNGVDVGDLKPGQQKPWALRDAGSGGGAIVSGFSVENQLWGNSSLNFGSGGRFACIQNGPTGFVQTGPGGFVQTGPGGFSGPGIVTGCGASPTGPAGTASLPIWSAGPVGLAPGSRSTGMAVAVGWTRGYQPPVTVGGHNRMAKGRTAVVGTAAVQPVAPLGDLAVWRQVIRGQLSQVGPGMFVDTTNSGQRTTVAWGLPLAIAGHQLSLAIPAGTGEVDVWSSGAWRKVSDGTPNSGNGGAIAFPSIPQFIPPPVFFGPTTAPAPQGPLFAPTTTFVPGGQIPFPATTVPVGPPGVAGSGGATTVALGPADIDHGTMYVRLGTSSLNQPINLDALQVTVMP
jgi:hypothetical protein